VYKNHLIKCVLSFSFILKSYQVRFRPALMFTVTRRVWISWNHLHIGQEVVHRRYVVHEVHGTGPKEAAVDLFMLSLPLLRLLDVILTWPWICLVNSQQTETKHSDRVLVLALYPPSTFSHLLADFILSHFDMAQSYNALSRAQLSFDYLHTNS